MERIVECPSGLAGRVKHLAAKDASVVSDARAVRSGTAADRILKACWLDTEAPGPYPFGSGPVEWRRVLACDRTWAMLMIRIATYGEEEELDMRCPVCGHKFVWVLPLLELPYRELPQETREAIAAGKNRFETKFPNDGPKVWFKLLNGDDQRKALKRIHDGTDVVIAALMEQIVEVEGVEKTATETWVGDLSMGDVQFLVDETDLVDGGVDTQFEVACPVCQYEWTVDLPLDLQRMFTPRKASPERRKARLKARRAAE